MSNNVTFLLFWLGGSNKDPHQCDIPSFGCRWPRMRVWSLDLVASEWNGPQALTRSHPVPACISTSYPRHPLPGGNSRRFAPRLRLADVFSTSASYHDTRSSSETGLASFWSLAVHQVVHGVATSRRESRDPVRLIAALACMGCPLTRPVDLPHSVRLARDWPSSTA